MQRKPLHKLLRHKRKQLPHKRVQPLTQRKLQFKP